jgi:hypothetical protein
MDEKKNAAFYFIIPNCLAAAAKCSFSFALEVCFYY